MILDGIDYGDGYTKATEPGPLVEWRSDSGLWVHRTARHTSLFYGETYRRPMTQAEKAAEAVKAGTVDPLVSQVVDAIKTGGWNRDLATRIIAMVREHDAKHLPDAGKVMPEPRMSLHEAEMYADEMENATIDYFRSSTQKNSKHFCDTKAKLILALTGAVPDMPKKEGEPISKMETTTEAKA